MTLRKYQVASTRPLRRATWPTRRRRRNSSRTSSRQQELMQPRPNRIRMPRATRSRHRATATCSRVRALSFRFLCSWRRRYYFMGNVLAKFYDCDELGFNFTDFCFLRKYIFVIWNYVSLFFWECSFILTMHCHVEWAITCWRYQSNKKYLQVVVSFLL